MTDPTTVENAGTSTCPLCGKEWLVTRVEDCMMPACGHYGFDASAANPNRPCEPCGIRHAWSCPDLPQQKEQADPPPSTVVRVNRKERG